MRGEATHPRYGTPTGAIAAQAVWSSVLVLTGSFEALLTYTGFSIALFSGLAVASLFVLRRRRGAGAPAAAPAEPGFRASGYPLLPALFTLVSAAMLANAVWRAPGPSLAGVAVMGAGGVWFALATRRGGRAVSPDAARPDAPRRA